MKLILSIGLLLSLCAKAQKKITLLAEPLSIASKYHFSGIKILDSRIDTTILGRVVRGTFGLSESLAPLQLNGPNQSSFEAFYQGCTQHLEKGSQDILIHITDIFVDEDPVSGAFGTVDVRVEIYAVKDNLYYPVYTLDQYEVVTAFDATKKLIRTLTTGLKKAVEYANNSFTPAVFDKPGFTQADLLNLKYKERKGKFAAYADEKVQDGIYGTLEEFLSNKPERSVNMMEEVITKNMAKAKRKREAIFGYSREGQMFIYEGNKYDTVRIYRRGDEFYMQNYGVDHTKQETQNGLLWFTSVALLGNTDSWYEFLLNPRTGNWYQMSKLGNKKRVNTEPPVDEMQSTSSN